LANLANATYLPREIPAASDCRPDFLLWLHDTLLFWGEEKSISGADDGLVRKRQHFNPRLFDDEIPYTICYAANRPKVHIYSIDLSTNASAALYPSYHSRRGWT
jgi:hypothetical protein